MDAVLDIEEIPPIESVGTIPAEEIPPIDSVKLPQDTYQTIGPKALTDREEKLLYLRQLQQQARQEEAKAANLPVALEAVSRTIEPVTPPGWRQFATAVPADIGTTLGGGVPFENIRAWFHGEQTPYSKYLAEAKPGFGTAIERGTAGLVGSIPELAVGGGVAKLAKLPSLLAPLAYGGVFGAGKYAEAGSPKEALITGAIATAFPAVVGIGKGIGGKVGESLVESGLLKSTNKKTLQGIELLGEQAAMQAFGHAISIPDYWKMDPEQRKYAVLENTIANVLWAIPGIIHAADPNARSLAAQKIAAKINPEVDSFNTLIQGPEFRAKLIDAILRQREETKAKEQAELQYREGVPKYVEQKEVIPDAEKPVATFVGYTEAPGQKPLPFFNVKEGEDQTTITPNGLAERGIPVPKIPSFEEWKKQKLQIKQFTPPPIELIGKDPIAYRSQYKERLMDFFERLSGDREKALAIWRHYFGGNVPWSVYLKDEATIKSLTLKSKKELNDWENNKQDAFEFNNQFNVETIANDEDVSSLAEAASYAARTGPLRFELGDRLLYFVAALNRLKELGGTWRDISKALWSHALASSTTKNQAEEYYRSLVKMVKQSAEEQNINLPFEPSKQQPIIKKEQKFLSQKEIGDVITIEDINKLLSRPGRLSQDELNTIEFLADYHRKHGPEFLVPFNDIFSQAVKLLGDVPYDRTNLITRILSSQSVMEGRPEDFWPIPIYVSAEKDSNTIGLLLRKDGKFEMFEGNDEATPATYDLVNNLLGVGEKSVRVWTNQSSDVINLIKSGNIPEGIFVSPDKKHAAGYWVEGHLVFLKKELVVQSRRKPSIPINCGHCFPRKRCECILR